MLGLLLEVQMVSLPDSGPPIENKTSRRYIQERATDSFAEYHGKVESWKVDIKIHVF